MLNDAKKIHVTSIFPNIAIARLQQYRIIGTCQKIICNSMNLTDINLISIILLTFYDSQIIF